MIISFLLFRVMAGDVAAIYAGEKGWEQDRADWRHRHGYDLPLVFNFHKQLVIEDKAGGKGALDIKDIDEDSQPVGAMGLTPSDDDKYVFYGRFVFQMDKNTAIEKMTDNKPLIIKNKARTETVLPVMRFESSTGKTFDVDLSDVKTCGGVIRAINSNPGNLDEATGKPLVEASISKWSPGQVFNAQFWPYLISSATFQSRSLQYNEKLTDIIVSRAPYSLALTVPAMALGWLAAMIISSFVAYYRDTWIDKIGVFLSVLGMCIPFLAFMILGQWVMFQISPEHAYGLVSGRGNIYVPIAIMVIAGLGGSVRFYRTVILDEINRDYVRTARAKGAPLTSVLFKHVLKNCMLPILTNLILAIPFLIMGSLLVESSFGIPGLGDLMITSINSRDEPIITGMVFLTALIYTIGLLLTDLSYVLFDPRIRVK